MPDDDDGVDSVDGIDNNIGTDSELGFPKVCRLVRELYIGDNMQDAPVQSGVMDDSAVWQSDGYDMQDGAFVQDVLAQGGGMGGSADLQGVGGDGKDGAF